jgi:hypothetical protein
MLLAPLAGAALVMSVAIGPAVEPQGAAAQMSTQQKTAAVEALVQSATACIVQAVAADPRFAAAPVSAIGDLIVDSIPSCVRAVRAMIDGYDRYYGVGTGQAFFMGPYLDALPTVVARGAGSPAQ